jgi:hypothetical protein
VAAKLGITFNYIRENREFCQLHHLDDLERTATYCPRSYSLSSSPTALLATGLSSSPGTLSLSGASRALIASAPVALPAPVAIPALYSAAGQASPPSAPRSAPMPTTPLYAPAPVPRWRERILPPTWSSECAVAIWLICFLNLSAASHI